MPEMSEGKLEGQSTVAENQKIAASGSSIGMCTSKELPKAAIF